MDDIVIANVTDSCPLSWPIFIPLAPETIVFSPFIRVQVKLLAQKKTGSSVLANLAF